MSLLALDFVARIIMTFVHFWFVYWMARLWGRDLRQGHYLLMEKAKRAERHLKEIEDTNVKILWPVFDTQARFARIQAGTLTRFRKLALFALVLQVMSLGLIWLGWVTHAPLYTSVTTWVAICSAAIGPYWVTKHGREEAATESKYQEIRKDILNRLFKKWETYEKAGMPESGTPIAIALGGICARCDKPIEAGETAPHVPGLGTFHHGCVDYSMGEKPLRDEVAQVGMGDEVFAAVLQGLQIDGLVEPARVTGYEFPRVARRSYRLTKPGIDFMRLGRHRAKLSA